LCEQAEAVAYVQISVNGNRVCGVAKSGDIVEASFKAVLNAMARAGYDASEILLQVDRVS